MKDAKLNLRLTAELLNESTREAERRGLTLSDWIRGLMAEATGGPLLDLGLHAHGTASLSRNPPHLGRSG